MLVWFMAHFKSGKEKLCSGCWDGDLTAVNDGDGGSECELGEGLDGGVSFILNSE